MGTGLSNGWSPIIGASQKDQMGSLSGKLDMFFSSLAFGVQNISAECWIISELFAVMVPFKSEYHSYASEL